MGILRKRIDKQIAAYQREHIETPNLDVDNKYHQNPRCRPDSPHHRHT